MIHEKELVWLNKMRRMIGDILVEVVNLIAKRSQTDKKRKCRKSKYSDNGNDHSEITEKLYTWRDGTQRNDNSLTSKFGSVRRNTIQKATERNANKYKTQIKRLFVSL